jgi:hypothetical protein
MSGGEGTANTTWRIKADLAYSPSNAQPVVDEVTSITQRTDWSTHRTPGGTAENAIWLPDQAVHEYEKSREILTEHASEFEAVAEASQLRVPPREGDQAYPRRDPKTTNRRQDRKIAPNLRPRRCKVPAPPETHRTLQPRASTHRVGLFNPARIYVGSVPNVMG